MYPDPVLMANIFCAGRLDEILHQVVGPFRRAIRQHESDTETYVWILRSSDGGEHLKVHLHGPASMADPARALLQRAATAFPDCRLVWTRYRRSPVWLGGGPFLDDDGYVSRITRCLAAACERVLSLETDATGRTPHQVRQNALVEGLVAGLAVSGFPPDARLAYLAYHRDTLLRSQAREQRIEAMDPSIDVLRLAAHSVWARDFEDGLDGVVADWCRALAHLVWYIRPLCEDPEYRLDPLAEDPCFVPIFKAFHGFANQLGLNPVEEAFAHDVLWALSAAAPADTLR